VVDSTELSSIEVPVGNRVLPDEQRAQVTVTKELVTAWGG